jgi:uncharacterized surface protein with fasciclin (FAS1) repeats
MKKYFQKTRIKLLGYLIFFAVGMSLFVACKDDYRYDNTLPEWLGESLYDYLKADGNFTYTLKLIDDLNYTDVLKRTGSKTLFVANDSAFNLFFQNNVWNVSSYDKLSQSQKMLLMKYSMLDNAFLIETLSSYFGNGVLNEGGAMRRLTANSPLDSLGFAVGDRLPAGSHWNYYRYRGLFLLNDATPSPIVFFLQPFLSRNEITNDDVRMIAGLENRQTNDAHVFNCKIVKRDIVCSNGYLNVLDKVLVPPGNMAQYVSTNSQTTIFAKLLNRFSAPYFEPSVTAQMRALYPQFTDSIFEKKYFATNGGRVFLPNGTRAPHLLTFDPGWNSYSATGSIQADMAAMFVPTDQAMTDYFNSGIGRLLKDRFGYWDSIPDGIVLPFVKRHMRTSLIESVPSKFSKMVDDENFSLPVLASHIEGSHTAVNGQVYMTNEVYPPVDYISVYSPVLLSDNTQIMDWVIKYNTETARDGTPFAFYKLYLNSLTSNYTLFIPTDEYFDKYIDPIAYGQDVKAALKFWYNKETQAVNATIYKYNPTSDTVEDSIGVITSAAFITNRLHNMLDNHIVNGSVENGDGYYVTRSNDIIKVTGSGSAMKIQGGGDLVNNSVANVQDSYVFRQANGSTYFIDKPLQPALKSAYKVLSETPQFARFFELLEGVPDTSVSQIFIQQGIDNRINFFNTYRYTIYVPTNEAIQAALDNGIITPWSTIYAITNNVEKSQAIAKMIRFLRYHFQDNAVFFGQSVNSQFQSATIKQNDLVTHWRTARNKYYKIGIVGSAQSMTLTTETNKTANVDTSNELYNLVVKDYIFNRKPSEFRNVDGSGNLTGQLFTNSSITSSASAVIHQIDNVLTFE